MSKQLQVIKALVLIFVLCGVGCSSMVVVQPPPTVDPVLKAKQEQELTRAQAFLEAQHAIEAEKAFTEFQKKYPVSVFYQAAQIGKAKALELQGKWSEAAELYRAVIEATRVTQPKIAAQALYEISFCYENLGDEARLMAALQDALRMKESLQPEWALAEIPARLAASSNRVGHVEDAQKYFQMADHGVTQLQAMHDKEATPVWIARIYYEMGLFSTNQLAYENLQTNLDTLKMVQIFSLRSIEMNGQPWSQMASEGLQANYRDLWNEIQDIPLNKSMDLGAAEREKVERQTDFVGQLLALINDLRRYRLPEGNEKNVALQDLLKFLKSVESQGSQFLNSSQIHTPLTPESKKRNALKREDVTIKAPIQQLPAKPEPSPSTAPQEQKNVPIDPNL